ncbi:olfactory receptor 5V1-like [Spea bombifrons]|uniref:olfactory receptor 5V1-like n=1 Tax=Spea bombifrons TaxID=233779 RepID=UPI002349F907|nr:olfactory receptor 5V1-like [Spea bombifrons]
MAGGNETTWTGFIFIGFPDILGSKSRLFVAFLFIYIMTVLGNFIIFLATTFNSSLQSPMYFLMGQLSFLDLCYISVTVPQMLCNFLEERNIISHGGCVAQLLLFISMEGTEALLLAAMAYDRYVAIRFPLNYPMIMNRVACVLMVVAAWIGGLCNSLVHTVLTFSLPFCGSHQLNHYFCDIPPLLKISCRETLANELVLFIVGGVGVGFSTFTFILITYIFIISTILKMSSTDGKHKAISTCASHLTVVMLFYVTAIFTYVRPSYTYSLQRERVVSILYSVVTPMLNPIIYSLRNKEIKRVVGIFFFKFYFKRTL